MDKLSPFYGHHLDDALLHIRKFKLFLSTRKLPNAGSADGGHSGQIHPREMAEIAYFGGSLQGPADTWFAQQLIGGEGGVKTCNELLERFAERFKFDEANQWREIAGLSKMKQAELQTTEEWIQEVEDKGRKIRASPDQIRVAVLNGLLPQIDNYIMQNDAAKETLQDIRKWGRIAERVIANTEKIKTGPSEMSALKKQMAELSAKLENTQVHVLEAPSAKKTQQTGAEQQIQSQTFYRGGQPQGNNYNQNREGGQQQQRSFRPQNGNRRQYDGQRNYYQQQQQQPPQQDGQQGGQAPDQNIPAWGGQASGGNYQPQNFPQGQWQNGPRQQNDGSNGCRSCNRWSQCPPGQCRALGQSCGYCGKMNHFASKCRARLMGPPQ